MSMWKNASNLILIFLLAVVLMFYQNCGDRRMQLAEKGETYCADCGRVDPALVAEIEFLKIGLYVTLSMRENGTSELQVHTPAGSCSTNLDLTEQDRQELFAALGQVTIFRNTPPDTMCTQDLPEEYEVLILSNGDHVRLADHCSFHNYSTGKVELACATKRVLEGHDQGVCAADLNAFWSECP